MKKHALHALIHEAFKDVTLGDGIGVRAARVEDDFWGDWEKAAVEFPEIVREKDEQRWQDIPLRWLQDICESFSFTDQAGFRYLLPAAMVYSIGDIFPPENDRREDVWSSLQFHLCLTGAGKFSRINVYSPQQLKHLKKVSPKQNAKHYSLTPDQIKAVALFFNYWMREKQNYLYEPNRERLIKSRQATLKRVHESYQEYLEELSDEERQDEEKRDFLTLEEDLAVYDEECRILSDWMRLGGVQV